MNKLLDLLKSNTFYITLSAVIAVLLPFELILFSYAVLGPGHYLTEISWLHDKNYFSVGKWVGAVLLFITILALFFLKSNVVILTWLCLSVSVGLSINSKWLNKLALGVAFFCFYFLLDNVFHSEFNILLAALVPTIIHVSLFTFLFILSGYTKRKNPDDLRTLILMIVFSVGFFILPDFEFVLFPDFVNQNIKPFMDISKNVQKAFGFEFNSNVAMFRLISFAYTFHYLNWFSKTQTIGWVNVPRKRKILIGFLTVWFVSLYFISYEIGMAALTALSFGHVILELPLNVATVKTIWQKLFS